MNNGVKRTALVQITACFLLATLASTSSLESNPRRNKRNFFANLQCTYFQTGCNRYSSGIVLDAGSSSTKLKIYNVTETVGSSSLPVVSNIYSQRFNPGIASFLHDSDGLRTYLANILQLAKQKVPEPHHEDTPLLLMATAGLRVLNTADASTLINNIRNILHDKNYNPFRTVTVGILSGEEEGVYAWIAANYLVGYLDREITESVGVLEMGGGSTQITFLPKTQLLDNEFQVNIGGATYELYVRSYLQFGTDAINLWIGQVLSEWYPNATTVDNPCMLVGDSRNVTLEDGPSLLLNGSSDPEVCKKILEKILERETGIRCQPKPCAIGNVYQPSVDNIPFFATQGFTYAPNNLKVIDKDKILDMDRLEDAADKHCRRTLSQAVEAGIPQKLASTTCTMGKYIPALLRAYGFATNTTNIKVTSEIGVQSIDWSLGAMVSTLSGNGVTRRQLPNV